MWIGIALLAGGVGPVVPSLARLPPVTRDNAGDCTGEDTNADPK